jgi:hydroxymethylglutaryl-CoA lyase
MADSVEVMTSIKREPGVIYPVLVPNDKGPFPTQPLLLRAAYTASVPALCVRACARARVCANVKLWAAGYENAVKTGCSHIAVFTAASETFAQRNINSTIGDSLARYRELCKKAAKDGLQVRGYLSCVLGCPYEGHISPKKVADVAAELHEMGCYEISLGDTIGVGTAGSTHRMLDEVLKRVPLEKVAVHYHDTYGQALANILTSLQFGVATIDASVSGLGGCPYAVGATGNVATEDVVFMLHVRWIHSP